MIHESCDWFTERLVDYSDGELTEGEARRVAAHLEACPRCRGELALLARSLDIARGVWREAAELVEHGGGLPVRRSPPVGRWKWAGVGLAACAAALLASAALWLWYRQTTETDLAAGRKGVERAAPHAQGSAMAESGGGPDRNEDMLREVEAAIWRAGRRAKLEASIEILASQPGLEHVRRDAERYLAETFGEADAATEPARIENSNGKNSPSSSHSRSQGS